jgi:hypothetical protein
VTEHEKGGGNPAPQPFKLQGITIDCGDDVLLLFKGRVVRRRFSEYRPETNAVYLMRELWSTAEDADTGPWPPSMLRHPDILTGIIREIDGTD